MAEASIRVEPIVEEVPDGKVLYKKHPLAIRWFHWINFPVLFVMIWSGLMIYWANQVFHVGKYGPLFAESFFAPKAPHWIPNWIATATTDDNDKPIRVMYSMDARLADGMAWHFMFAWFFAINGLLYVIFLAVSGQWRLLIPKLAAVKESIHVVLFDLHLTKKPLPVKKYNSAQQIAYTGVIFMGALMLFTGIAIYKPSEQSWLTQIFGGYTNARFIHFWTTLGFLGFFLVHVAQVVKTGWNNFRGMLTGYELVTPEEKAKLQDQS